MNRPPILAALVGALFLSACAACGRTEPPALDGGIADSGADGGRRDGGIVDLDSGPPPVKVDGGNGCLDGWSRIQGLPAACGVACAWTEAAAPLTPVPWQACPALPATTGLPCTVITSGRSARRVASGEVAVSVDATRSRLQIELGDVVVGAYDIPYVFGPSCAASPGAVSARFLGAELTEWNGNTPLGEGVLVAKRSALADQRLLGFEASNGGIAPSFSVFAEGAVRSTFGASDLFDFDDPKKTYPLYDAAPYGGDMGSQREDLPGGFVGTPTNKGLYWVGSKATGPVLKFDGRRYADGSQVLGIGSDGTDLVWTRGFGGTPRINEREHAEFWRAPYNDPDPFAHGTRVLTNDVELGAKSTVVVGCGYAASRLRFGYDGVHPVRAGLVLVRLSDGRRWRFEDDAAQTGSVTDWQYMNPAALDCTHLYVTVDARLEADRAIRETIARFKIADLGPGIAP